MFLLAFSAVATLCTSVRVVDASVRFPGQPRRLMHQFSGVIGELGGLGGMLMICTIFCSSLMTSKTSCLVITMTSSPVAPSLRTVIGNYSMANGKNYLMKNLFGHTSMESF